MPLLFPKACFKFISLEILVFFTELKSVEFVTEVDIRPAGSPLGIDYVQKTL